MDSIFRYDPKDRGKHSLLVFLTFAFASLYCCLWWFLHWFSKHLDPQGVPRTSGIYTFNIKLRLLRHPKLQTRALSFKKLTIARFLAIRVWEICDCALWTVLHNLILQVTYMCMYMWWHICDILYTYILSYTHIYRWIYILCQFWNCRKPW